MRHQRVAVVHNAYQLPGGEDAVFRAETDLLERMGHSVVRYEVRNNTIKELGLIGRLQLGVETIWSRRSYQNLRQLFRDFQPDIVHFHNTFPLISPSGYYAAQAAGVPVVQTLHNYRLLCLNALLHCRGAACQACVGKWPLRGITSKCYRSDLMASATVAALLGTHRLLGTWSRAVDQYIVLSSFGRDLFIRGGLPGDRLSLRPNFLPEDPGPGDHNGDYALYVGRLTAEKGVNTLLDAWRTLPTGIRLRIAGEGPLEKQVQSAEQSCPNIEYIGPQDHTSVLRLMGAAKVVVFPSVCYEAFGLVLLEALAKGTPVVASRIGVVPELIKHGETGLLFSPGNAQDLAEQVERLWNSPLMAQRMGESGRTLFERNYTAEQSYGFLMEVYDRAWQQSTRRQ